jgi:hypothetical protein
LTNDVRCGLHFYSWTYFDISERFLGSYPTMKSDKQISEFLSNCRS